MICVLIGIPIGIWMSRSQRATAALTPVLDAMQTMPSFAYLAPLALLFGIGNAGAVIVTLIYALPPLVRITAHALGTVSPTTVEATTSTGVHLRTNCCAKCSFRCLAAPSSSGSTRPSWPRCRWPPSLPSSPVPGSGIPIVRALTVLNVGVAFVAGLCLVLDRHHARPRGGARRDGPRSPPAPVAANATRRIVLGVLGVVRWSWRSTCRTRS